MIQNAFYPEIAIRHIAAQTGLNRMGEKRRDEDWIIERRGADDTCFHVLVDQKPAVHSNPDRTNTTLRRFSRDDLAGFGIRADDAYFLGMHPDGSACFVVSASQADAVHFTGGPDAIAPLVDMRTLAVQSDIAPDELTIIAQGRSLAAWHATHRCCGRCGGRTISRDGGWRRECWACGQNHFPRSDPAVIMLITHEGRCLLGSEPRFPDNMYSVLAGFVEPGDDIETAVRREIMEEVGVRVGRVDYIGSQPWPFPHSLMVGCWGEALSAELTLDPVEIKDARWFSREDVHQMMHRQHPEGLFVPPPISISHTLIRAFVEGKLGPA
jgi:NAD+ diphosphatase